MGRKMEMWEGTTNTIYLLKRYRKTYYYKILIKYTHV